MRLKNEDAVFRGARCKRPVAQEIFTGERRSIQSGYGAITPVWRSASHARMEPTNATAKASEITPAINTGTRGCGSHASSATAFGVGLTRTRSAFLGCSAILSTTAVLILPPKGKFSRSVGTGAVTAVTLRV